MTFNFDSAFTFTSESDLLPIWYTAPDPFMLTSPFTNDFWEDPFETGFSEFQTFNSEIPTSSEYCNEGVNMAVVTPGYNHYGELYQGCESTLFQDQVEISNERDQNFMRDVKVVDDVHWERPNLTPQSFFGNDENIDPQIKRENYFIEKQENFSQNYKIKEECENFEKEDDDQQQQQNGNIYINDDKFPTYENGNVTAEDNNNNNLNSPRYDEDQIPDLALISGLDDPIDFKLPASKSPIMEAMVVCAIKNWGISIAKSTPSQVIFRVTDFDHYYKISRSICSKQHPTEDIGSRVKSLRRWFENFPKKKDRQDNPNFLLAVKPSGTKKVNEMIERNTRLLGIQKRRRRQ